MILERSGLLLEGLQTREATHRSFPMLSEVPGRKTFVNRNQVMPSQQRDMRQLVGYEPVDRKGMVTRLDGNEFASQIGSIAMSLTINQSSANLSQRDLIASVANILQPVSGSGPTLHEGVEHQTILRRYRQEIVSGKTFAIHLESIEYQDALYVKLINNHLNTEMEFMLGRDNSEGIFSSETTLGITVSVPTNYSLAQLCFVMTCLWITRAKLAEMVVGGHLKEKSSEAVKKGFDVVQDHECDSIGGLHFVTHDLECTVPDIAAYMLSYVGIVIPPDGTFYVWVPTLGRQVVDVHECCVDHDIALWCSRRRFYDEQHPTLSYAQLADVRVISCILGKVYDAFARGSLLEDIANIAWFMLTYSFTAVLVHLGSRYSAAYHDSYLLDLDGTNKNSCLCGGTEPTVLCNDRCRDLCRERGKHQRCSNDCKYSCEYDAYGRLKPEHYRKLINDSMLPCCPTTIAPCASPPACPVQNCNDCRWYCDACKVWNKDPECFGGYKKVYGSEYPGRDYRLSDRCCPTRRSLGGPGSQPRSESISCSHKESEDPIGVIRIGLI